jgi:CRAL/TRIO domain
MMMLLFFRERAKDLMPPGQESLMILVDYKSTTLRTNPSISVARKVLTILQHHYVETLGRAVVVNLPTILSFFYKGIAPFLDPVTREKMRFNPDLFELVPRGQLDADFGGDYQYEFDHEAYWNQLIQYVSPSFPLHFRAGNALELKLIGRACGVAPDGTRVTISAFPRGTQPSNIPTLKDYSPR